MAERDKRQQARDGAKKARELAAKLERAAGIVSDADRMRRNRAPAYSIEIPPPADLGLRAAMLADPYLFMQRCFPFTFRYAFTETRRQMVDAIVAAGRSGGDQAIAGPRGDGKTTCASFAGLWLVLTGAVDFLLLISKSGERAGTELRGLKQELRTSLTFCETFPEVGVPIASLRGHAHVQTAWGQPTGMTWTGPLIQLPTLTAELLHEHGWPADQSSLARGQIFSSLGIEGPIRGHKVGSRRPGLAIIDDIDSRESAASELQTGQRIEVIDKDVGGLGDERRTCSRIYLGTLINTRCAAAYYTDPSRRAWRPQRHALIKKFPERLDLWQEYVSQRTSRAPDDPDARAAHWWMVDRYEAMHAGAEVSNLERYNHDAHADGDPVERSALQAYYNWVSDKGEESALTELQNAPPDPQQAEADGLSPHRIQQQVSGYDRRIIPPGCTCLTMGIDVGKYRLHWVVIAWKPDGTSYVIDYGVAGVLGTTPGTDEGLEAGLSAAVRTLVNEKRDNPYTYDDGQPLPIGMTLIDEGWGLTTTVVRSVCLETAKPVPVGNTTEPDVQPAKGKGDAAKREQGGRLPGSYAQFVRRDWDHKPGDNWCRSKQLLGNTVPPVRIWIYLHNAGTWKDWAIQRWLTPIDKAGCRFSFGRHDQPHRHHQMTHVEFSKHACANCYRNELKGDRLVRAWGEREGFDGAKDHYQDAQELADVAASVLGIRLAVVIDQQAAAAPVVPAGGSWFASATRR